MGFKWGNDHVPDAGAAFFTLLRGAGICTSLVQIAPGARVPYAMNMRAAEAIVSSAPKPMKIFPIREV
jgi:hypothetical protein